MKQPENAFAALDPELQKHSERLLSLIVDAIQAAGGTISFADYMQKCLYTPGLGYYSAGLAKIGQAGDFVTAPEISPLFSYSLAQHVADVLQQLPEGDCLEFGAGNGTMARDILKQLDQLGTLPRHYYIIEASADLREKQQKTLCQTGSLAEKVIWLDQLPAQFMGVILANEVCDAMPVHQIIFEQDQVYENCVSWQNDQLCWQRQRLDTGALLEQASAMTEKIPEQPFVSEINLYAAAWLSSLAQRLQRGALFIIDYGHSERDYFQPQRAHGSIRCHYQHQVHDNPLILPGLQDITAHVQFTALAETAFEQGLAVSGYQRQNDFLLAGDIMQLVQQQSAVVFSQLQTAAALKRLLLPDQMGEMFKVLTLTKQLDTLPRLQPGDLRHQL